MIKIKSKSFFEIRDRKLGDEWNDWQGNLSDGETNANAGKRIFLGVVLLSIILTGVSAYFTWYLIGPRLFQFHPNLPVLVGYIFFFSWLLLSGLFLLMVLSIITEKDFLIRWGHHELSITFLIPLAWKLGQKLGISRDRLGNSFVKVSNALIRTHVTNVQPEKLLILLPRCMQKQVRKIITDFSKRMHIPVFTVPGGEMARKLILDYHPAAIIGVACERDLVSGIQDVIDKIPVIGVPNIRPEGPCKNTVIDIKEFERAVQTFLGPDVQLTSPSPHPV